ncbi:MAG: hypothetical protein C4519_10760 [Desulfobacteraceae bacterium]|nr:MAG: hypothetical protein C4519_10760 [Desulfobacteraceae bacterium]
MKFSIGTVTKEQAKDTGMAMVLILLLTGFVTENPLFIKIAVPVLIIDMIVPAIYKPVALIWLRLSHLIGTFVSRILLTLVFYLVVTPIGLIRQILGYDSLYLKKFKGGSESVMKVRVITYDKSDIEKPY